jgi:hypothetical protein
MVHMGVREQDRTQGFGVKPQVAVAPDRFVSTSLKHSTIEQQLEARHLQEMSAAGDRPSGSEE